MRKSAEDLTLGGTARTTATSKLGVVRLAPAKNHQGLAEAPSPARTIQG